MAKSHSNDRRAVALVRFSPRPLPEEAKSLEVQSERIASYAARESLEIVETFKDPETSARRTPLAKRPGGAAMIAYVERHGIKHIIVQKLDRAFRDTLDGLQWLRRWKKQGVSLHLADQGGCAVNCSTATGELVMTFLLGVASFEPAQTAERTSQSMKHRQKNGQRMSSRIQFGFRLEGGLLVPDEAEQELGSFFEANRNLSLKDIAAMAERMGYTFRGGKIHRSLVWRVLKERATA